MKKVNVSRFVCTGGILTTATVIFQSAPVFFPTAGLFISPLSTLPVAVAAAYDISLGLAVFFSSALMLAIVSVQESVILLLATGLLGVVIGTLLNRKGIVISIVISGAALFAGIVVLTYIIGVPALVDFTCLLPPPLILLISFIFSLVYAGICNIIIRKIIRCFAGLKLMS